jgi:hypothetical protein
MAKDTGALVLYGRGADFGSFKPFVDDFITTELGTRIPKARIEVKNTERWKDFWEALGSFGQRFNIAELHIFSHSYGAGLSLGYKDPALQMERGAMLDTATMAGRKVTAQEVLATEKGIIFTDDLVDPHAGCAGAGLPGHVRGPETDQAVGLQQRRCRLAVLGPRRQPLGHRSGRAGGQLLLARAEHDQPA